MPDNKKTVLDAMAKAGKPLKAGEVAAATGLDNKEVAKVINELKNEDKITSPKRCYYEPI